MDLSQKITTYNFSALEQPLTKQDMAGFKQAHRASLRRQQKLAIALAIGAVLFSAVYIGLLVGRSARAILPAMILPLGFGVMGSIWWYSAHKRLRLQARLYKFAADNQLVVQFNRSLRGAASMVDAPNGMIFETGHSQMFRERIELSPKAEIGNFTYQTGSGKSRRTYFWGYARFKLPRRVPNMVLDARANNKWLLSNLDVAFKRSQRLSLEGDFDRSFSLYAPDAYKRDALYIFTPDVMAVLVDYGRDFDFELVEDELFIYAKGAFKLDQAATYKNLAVMAETIYRKIEGQSEKYADERVGDRTANIVGAGGQRLKRRIGWVIIILFIIWISSAFVRPIIDKLFGN